MEQSTRVENWCFVGCTRFGLSCGYAINYLLGLGVEANGSENDHYFGPVISHGKGWYWVTLGSAFNLGSVKESKPDFQMRLLMGIGL